MSALQIRLTGTDLVPMPAPGFRSFLSPAEPALVAVATACERDYTEEDVEGRYPTAGPVIELKVTGRSTNVPTVPSPSKEQLLSAKHVRGNLVDLRFSDDFTGEVDFTVLGLNTSRLQIPTVRASSWGGSAELEDSTGHTVHIDSSVLRAHIDPDYAAVLREAIAELAS